LKISLPEEMHSVQINEKWGQEIFVNGLAGYIQGFIKHALRFGDKAGTDQFLRL